MPAQVIPFANKQPPQPFVPRAFVGFSASGGIGRIIRLFTGGSVNHAFIIYYDMEYATWMTVGANANGVTMLPIAQFVPGRTIVALYEPKGFSLWDGLRTHVSDLGKHYDYAGLFGMAFVEIERRLHSRGLCNILDHRDDLFCSEWAAEVIDSALACAGQTMLADFPLAGTRPDVIDPQWLCDTLKGSELFVPVPTAAIMGK